MVWITYNGSARVYELQASGFPIEFAYPKEGALIFGNWFDVLKGAPSGSLAHELVNHLISPEAEALFAQHVLFGPINRQTRLEPAVAGKVPFGPEQVGRMIKLDFVAMHDNVGATRWTAFRRVTLPLIRPGVVAGAAFAAITSFDDVSVALFLASPRTVTLPVRIFSYIELTFDPLVTAVCSVLIVLVLVAVVVLDRTIGLARLFDTD